MTATGGTPAPVPSAPEGFLAAGSTRQGPFDVVVTPESAGWGYSSLRVLDLAPGEGLDLVTGDAEVVVVPLAGGAVDVAVTGGTDGEVGAGPDGGVHRLRGRAHVFAGPTDVLYLPQGTALRLTAPSGARVALPGARVPAGAERLPVRVRRAEETAVELRGAGTASRQVHGFADAATPGAHRLIAVEVITPGGNWSSYPPHKHDETSAHESQLEEVYYYEIAPGPSGTPGLGYHRSYGTAERPLDLLAEVRSGDTVLVPHGWHGPCVAAPGYDMYYLNVMAGPEAERAWRIVDDPDHAWVRGTWDGQVVDPRLPLHAPAAASAPATTPTPAAAPVPVPGEPS